MSTAGRNALVTSLVICCGFIVCCTPNNILVFLYFLGYHLDFSSWYYHFTVVLVFSNSCINPFIYAAKYHEFQQAVRRLKSKLSQQQAQVAVIV